ncbi:MAG: hypothetical protein J6A01_00885 [Proteobacteria bacterium]|nr:hypothetical protein [Pseudomonadota bacterium]
MIHFFSIIIFGVCVVTSFYNANVQDKADVMDESRNMVAETFTVTGTITKVTIGDVSKKRGKEHLHLKMHLHLKPHDSPNEELYFIRYPAAQSDKLWRAGQSVSITAYKPSPDFPENAPSIIHIEPL